MPRQEAAGLVFGPCPRPPNPVPGTINLTGVTVSVEIVIESWYPEKSSSSCIIVWRGVDIDA